MGVMICLNQGGLCSPSASVSWVQILTWFLKSVWQILFPDLPGFEPMHMHCTVLLQSGRSNHSPKLGWQKERAKLASLIASPWCISFSFTRLFLAVIVSGENVALVISLSICTPNPRKKCMSNDKSIYKLLTLSAFYFFIHLLQSLLTIVATLGIDLLSRHDSELMICWT